MSCDKACGLDGIVTEVLKLNEIHITLLKIINEIYNTGHIPSEWLVSVLVPIYKNKGSSSDPNNYRGIALMSIVAKLFNRLLLERLRGGLETKLRYNQNGFRKLRSTAQHVLAARRLIEEIRDSQTGKLVSIFIDFTKAFDSVNWSWMRAILLAYNVPIKLVDTIMSLYHGATAKVKLENNEFTDFISLSSGVLQGDTLAPYLFIIVLDYVLRSAIPDESLGIQLTLSQGTRSRPKPSSYLTDLDFADDIMLVSDNIKNAQSMLSSIEYHAQLVGLSINLKKTEYILIGEFKESVDLSLNSGLIKQVKDFKYLG
jgi:hypothetical protein